MLIIGISISNEQDIVVKGSIISLVLVVFCYF